MIAWRIELGRGALAWLAAVLIACSAYEPARLQGSEPSGGRGGDDVGRSDAGGNDVGGSDGSGSGGAAAGGTGGSGGQASPACGDGKVAASEKCDTAINEGPGMCPTACPPIGQCVARMLNGSNCQAECVVLAATCSDDDGCCPQTCSVANDDDCSDNCGDGTVQEDEGETCESNAAAGVPCPTQADCDDDDPCTSDTLMGSEANCNSACAHTTISALRADDQCCPDGANANNDNDCAPDCGNQVKESGEECDGGASCDGDCKRIPTAQQQSCIDRFVKSAMPEDAACERCACFECMQEVLDCRDDSDATRRMRCDVLVACGLENDCTGLGCYCGTADIIACGTGSANGPCIPEVEQAAGPSTNPLEINQRQRDPMYALGRANLLGSCAAQKCPDFCP